MSSSHITESENSNDEKDNIQTKFNNKTVEELKKNFECYICLKNFKNPMISNCCSNITCLTCISRWIYKDPSCPNC